LHPFEYVEPRSLDQAVALLLAQPDETQIIAGGTDLLSEMKEGVVRPQRLVGLAGIPGLLGIATAAIGVTIGAMTTIAELAAHPVIRSRYTALAEAAAGLATPQIRHVGTLGGNLNQRPRCWYYRHPLIQCLKKGGDRCYALAGNSKYLCVTGGDRCYIVHPSDTAVALTALGASVEIAGPGGYRILPIEQYFIGPGQDLTRENILAPGELVTRVHVPGPSGPWDETELPLSGSTPHPNLPPQGGKGFRRSLYLKAGERESGDFALVSVAAAVTVDEDTPSASPTASDPDRGRGRSSGRRILQAAVVLGGVAPVPYRARQVEQYLQGKSVGEVDSALAGSLALPDARPMADNRYKVILAANLVKQAVRQLLIV
jgi:xanthine dehydrogenase YagS FAD-binding subunit